MLSISINVLLTIHVIVSLLIVFIVLMQRPKSEGLGAAFGGEMMGDLFSANTSNVLASITRWLGGIFFVLSLVLAVLYARVSTQRSFIQEEALRHAAPVVAASPSPAASPLLPKNPAAEPSPSAAPFSSPTSLSLTPGAAPSPALNLASPAPSAGGTSAGH